MTRLFSDFGSLLVAFIAMCTLPAAQAADLAVVSGCGTIGSDTTWSAGQVYALEDCDLVVAADARLTVQPGVVLKFTGARSALIVQGTLQALGTASEPIVFSSGADDARGGDSNGDGSATAAAAGDWYGIVLMPGSSAQLQQFFLGYAGSGQFNSALGRWNRAAVDVEGAVELRDGEIAHGLRKGVYLSGEGLSPVLHDLKVNHYHGPDASRFGYPVYQTTPNMQPSYADLTLENNDFDRVMIAGWRLPLTQDVTLAGAPFSVDCGYTVCQVSVADGLTMRIAPGTDIDFSNPNGGSAPYGIAVESGGRLIAEGTVGQPIKLSSSRAETGSTAHNWYGLWAKPGSEIRLAQCDLGWAKHGNYGAGGLQIETSNASVSDCRIHHTQGSGLYLTSAAAGSIDVALNDLELVDNTEHGLYLLGRSAGRVSASLMGGSISHNGLAGIIAYGSQSTIGIKLTALMIEGNGRLGSASVPTQSAGIYTNSHDVSLDLDTVAFVNNPDAAVRWYCDGSLTVKSVTATGNGDNAIVFPACSVNSGRQWDLKNAGIPVRASGHLRIERDAFLSIQPGSTLRFDAARQLYVAGGSLYAIGSASDPIRFLGSSETPGHWTGIYISSNNAPLYNNAKAYLSYCEIAHAGSSSSSNAGVYVTPYMGAAVIQNCRLHQNTIGITSGSSNAVIRNNEIADNTAYGVKQGGYDALVDARGNYWGKSSGPYHPVTNPSGEGNAVSDHVLFEPWLQSPPEDAGALGDRVIVSVGSPDFVSPGQTIDLVVKYVNLRSEPVTNALLVLQLPQAAEYQSSSHAGQYWSERDQVVWELGNIAPGASGLLTVRMRLMWGLPRNYRDGALALLSGDDYLSDTHSSEERSLYHALNATVPSGFQPISEAEYQAERNAEPALAALHQQALTEGFVFQSAAHTSRSGSGTATGAIYIHPQRQDVRILGRQGARVSATTLTADAYTLHDSSGGTRISLATGERSSWGDWAVTDSALGPFTMAKACTYESCRNKCFAETIGWVAIGKKAARIAAWAKLSVFSGGATTFIGVAVEAGDLIWTGLDTWKCTLDCQANPNTHCCQAGQVKWTKPFGISLITQCFKSTCGPLGTWVSAGSKTCVSGLVTGTRCVASIGGIGCVPCDEQLRKVSQLAPLQDDPSPTGKAAASCDVKAKAGLPSCKELELFVAKDPNEIIGPQGDVLPGQLINYTINYENEGAGRAYGVYVINDLPSALDETSLNVAGGGWYVAGTRQLVWLVGELGPKGDSDAEGSVGYSVRVRSGQASGTAIANSAVVHFPSVPEVTPTNTWTNQVQPLTAAPQSLSTDYMAPLPIMLNGQDVSNLPLTYRVVQSPLRGSLSGTPPNLSYSPAKDVVGTDSFTFAVSNGVSESREAMVRIEVSSSGDSHAPQILDSFPAPAATQVAVGSVASYTDAQGDAFSPVIVISLSEALDPDSLTAQRLTLVGPEGEVTVSTSFDATANRILMVPRQALAGQSVFTLSLAEGITDLAGNALPALSFSFTTAVAPEPPSPRIFQDGFESQTAR